MKMDYILAVTGDYTYKENIKREALLRRNLFVDYVQTMEEALNRLLDKDYVLVIVRADTVENLSLLRVMRNLKSVPILVFSYTEPNNKTEALKMGAHVYIASPYSLDYIIESSYALSQLYPRPNGRYEEEQPTFFTYEYIRVCVDSRQVFVRGKLVDLTKNDFNLLCLLMQNKGKVVTYSEIFRLAWGEEYVDSSLNSLNSAVKRLKKKMSSIEPATKNYIKNIRQVGYSFDPS